MQAKIEVFMLIHGLISLWVICPTAGVTGAGAGVDSAWEQRKLEARKMLVNRARSPQRPVHAVLGGIEPESYSLGELVVSELSIGNAKAPEYKPKGSETRRR